jgi:hypothetical protein
LKTHTNKNNLYKGNGKMDILELRKKSLAALLLASVALVMLPGCSTTEEEGDAATEEQSNKDMLCDEADAGTTECPQ